MVKTETSGKMRKKNCAHKEVFLMGCQHSEIIRDAWHVFFVFVPGLLLTTEQLSLMPVVPEIMPLPAHSLP